MIWSLKALLRSGSKRARAEHAQRTPGVMVSAGLCGKATPQLLGPFFIEDSCKIDSGVYCRILEDNYASAMSLIPAPVVWQEDNAPSHHSKPRGTGRRRTFITPNLVGLHSLQTWPRWTTASGRPWSPRFQRSVFHRRLLSKHPLPVHLLWSRRLMFLTRRSVRSRIAFNSVSMPTEAFSRHDFLQMLHSWCESENTINPNYSQQRSNLSSKQASRQTAHM